jgi:hypothetical protein
VKLPGRVADSVDGHGSILIGERAGRALFTAREEGLTAQVFTNHTR